MTAKSYKITSSEGANFAGNGAKVGDTVTLDLDDDREQALVAAGWLEPTTTKKGSA